MIIDHVRITTMTIMFFRMMKSMRRIWSNLSERNVALWKPTVSPPASLEWPTFSWELILLILVLSNSDSSNATYMEALDGTLWRNCERIQTSRKVWGQVSPVIRESTWRKQARKGTQGKEDRKESRRKQARKETQRKQARKARKMKIWLKTTHWQGSVLSLLYVFFWAVQTLILRDIW